VVCATTLAPTSAEAGHPAVAGDASSADQSAGQSFRQSAGTPRASLDRRLLDARITESSGLDRSTRHPGVVLTHNDSGDGPRVFAVGTSGRTRAVWTLSGAGALDWEDMATGRGHTVWVGDIGDNAVQRDRVQVYAFTEPPVLRDRAVPSRRYELTYPDGAHNAEALLVRPRSGRLLVVTKASRGAGFYRAPRRLTTTGGNRLVRIGPAPSLVTAGSVRPGGGQICLRDYRRAYLYGHVGAPPTRVALPSTQQGESLTYGAGGRSLRIGSEGADSPVWRIPLR
jgi:hypothetical protein